MQFDPTHFLRAEPAVQVHMAAGILAVLLGTLVVAWRKGGRWHVWAGRIWMGTMVVIALSSFGIHQLRTFGPFSPLHLLSLLTLVSVAMAIYGIRRRILRMHVGSAVGLYVGGCLFAGALTFAPGLLMHRTFIGTSDAITLGPVFFVTVALIGALAIGIAMWALTDRISRSAR